MTSKWCQISKCSRRADFALYNKPVCNFHGFKIQEVKRANPQAFINWKKNTNQGYGIGKRIAPGRTYVGVDVQT